ncbi:CoA-dependent acyltransferase [Neoconidiobolus thromboides FSU 785]|nr:CoA-dependent acyltransferase [Neoconidiobolus thromboides FSU 785]
MTEGSVSRWNIKEGTSFSAGDVLLEIETDKAQIEVEAPEDGILAKILVQANGEKVPVGQAIAIIAEEGDDISNIEAPKEEAKAKEPVKENKVEKKIETKADVTMKQDTTQKSTHLSPAVGHLISNYQIDDIKVITATGPKGRLSKGDVLNYINKNNIPKRKVEQVESRPIKLQANQQGSTGNQVPHNYTRKQVEIEQIESLRQSLLKSKGIKVSLNDVIVKAASLALIDTPQINVRFNDSAKDNVEYLKSIDIAVATSTPNGLIASVVSDANKKELEAISKELKVSNKKANENQGASFGISNLGVFGVNNFSGLVTPPPAANLTINLKEVVVYGEEITNSNLVLDDLIHPTPKKVNEIKPQATATPNVKRDILDQLIDDIKIKTSSENSGLKTRKVLNITLASDQRVVTQDIAAKFLKKLEYYLSQKSSLL